jgi:hypothetical protein
MKKILILIGILLILFFFCGHLTGYWTQFFGEVKEDPTEWLVQKRDGFYLSLPEMDFTTAIQSLSDFENSINENLSGLNKSEEDEDNKRAYHRSLICELAVVYKKTAMLYLNNGKDDLYIAYTRKSQDKLVECANLK